MSNKAKGTGLSSPNDAMVIESLKLLLKAQPHITRNSTVPKEELIAYIDTTIGGKIVCSTEQIQKLLQKCVADGKIIAFGGNYKFPDRKMSTLVNESKETRSSAIKAKPSMKESNIKNGTVGLVGNSSEKNGNKEQANETKSNLESEKEEEAKFTSNRRTRTRRKKQTTDKINGDDQSDIPVTEDYGNFPVGRGNSEKAPSIKVPGRKRKQTIDGVDDEDEDFCSQESVESPVPKTERTRRVKRARVVFDPSDFEGMRKRSKSEKTSGPTGTQEDQKNQTPDPSKSDAQRQKLASPVSPDNDDWNLHVDSPLESDHESDQSTPQKDPVSVAGINLNPGLCHKCGSNKINARDEMEDLIICAGCSLAAHPSCLCLSGRKGTARKALLSSWLCITCEIEACLECMKIDFPDGTKLTCTHCESNYHKDCVAPQPKMEEETEDGSWCCAKCRASPPSKDVENRPHQTDSSSKSEPKLTEKELTEIPSRFLVLPPGLSYYGVGSREGSETPKPTIEVPDPTSWTPEEVTKYFSDAGFDPAAQTFKDQEIDGSALLLMSRTDMLKGMGLKIGVAVKMFQHVVSMQYKFKPA